MSDYENPVFPSEFVSPSDKEENKYGLAYAEAMYYSSNRQGARLLYDDEEYDALIALAQGRQSVDNIKNLFGHFTDSSVNAPQGPNDNIDDSEGDLAYIDIQVLNLAPKYINRAVGRLQAIKYDITASVLDVKSIDQEKNFKKQLTAFYDLKQWMDTIGLNAQEMFSDIDVSKIPEEPDEMLFEMNTNPKVKKIIKAEKLLKIIHYNNNWTQLSREVDWDHVVIGKGFIHNYLDENGVNREERINPKWAVYPYSESEAWDVDYFGFIDFVPFSQFIRESAKEFTVKEQQEIMKEFGRDNNYLNTGERGLDGDRYDGMRYVPVMRYYFLSEDRKVYDSKISKNTGNRILVERAYDYTVDEDMAHLYTPEGPNKIIPNTYTSLYAGNYIIGSERVYNHRREEYPKTTLVDMKAPIVAFAPNYKEGRVVSLAAQLIEPIYMVNVAWNKIKDVLAKGWMGVREIDLSRFEQVALGKSGRKWSEREVYKHLLKTNTMVVRGGTSQYGQDGPAIKDTVGGLQLADYFTTLSTALRLMDELTGTSSFEGSNPPERLAVGVANANLAASHEGMEYLYNAHEWMYLECSKRQLLLAQMSHKQGNKVAGSALGKYFEMDDDLAYSEIGLMLTRKPTDQEWIEFYQDIREAVKLDKLRGSDSAFIREVDNLKEARRVLAIREEKYARIKAKEGQQIQANEMAKIDAANQGKVQGKLAEINAKKEADKEMAILDGQIKEMLMAKEYGYNASINKDKGIADLAKTKQQGTDRILTQGVKNIVEKQKVEKREDKSPED